MIRASAVGVDSVLNVWDSMNDGMPYFAIYYNRSNKFFQFNRDDLSAAREFLANNLQALQDSGDNTLYYLNIYSESRPNYKNSDMICSIPFRLNAYNEASSVGGFDANVGTFAKMLNDSHAAQLKMANELAELKSANQPLDWYDKITGILESPAASQTLVPLLTPVIGAIMGVVSKITGVPPGAASVPGISGPAIDDADLDTKLDAALDRLSKHGDLLEMITALADFADKNPATFKSYFSMLKAQS